MTYLRSLFLNFLIVFFVNRVIPGVQIDVFEEVPNVGADLFFSLVVGFLNASVFPFFAVLELHLTRLRIVITNFIISFGAFGIISFVPFGVQVKSFSGFLFAGLIVWVVAYFSNYLEWRHNLAKK